MNDEVHFCHADKHRSFLQVDNIILGLHSQSCPKYPMYAMSPGKRGG